MSVKRYLDGPLFADVPTAAGLHEPVEITRLEGDEGGGLYDCVVMNGRIILHNDDDATCVVSCGGLLARIPDRVGGTSSDRVRVCVRQRHCHAHVRDARSRARNSPAPSADAVRHAN